MPETDDPIGQLLADDALTELLRLVCLASYAEGWIDSYAARAAAFVPLPPLDRRLRALILAAGVEWQARLALAQGAAPVVPEWLRRAQDERHEDVGWRE